MNSATPGTLISYRFSPASCCISSCPTILPLSPHAHLMLTYPLSLRLLILTGSFATPPSPPTADCQKNNFLFSPDSLLSFSRLLFVSRAAPRWDERSRGAELKQMFRCLPALPPYPGWSALGRCDQVKGTLSPAWI